MGIALSSFDTVTRSNAGVEMQLKDLRSGKPSGAFITVLGTDGDTFRAIREERSRMLADRAAAGESVQISDAERTDMLCDMLARCTLGWRGIDSEDGNPMPPYSYSVAYSLYKMYPAIREQVNVFVAERANFAPA